MISKIPKTKNLKQTPSTKEESIDIRGVHLNQVIDKVQVVTGKEFLSELDFSVAPVLYMKEKTQSDAIAFSAVNLNEDQIGNVMYVKITTDDSGLTFSSDFIEARNDATGAADEVLDCWFTVLPDLKVQYTITIRE